MRYSDPMSLIHEVGHTNPQWLVDHPNWTWEELRRELFRWMYGE